MFRGSNKKNRKYEWEQMTLKYDAEGARAGGTWLKKDPKTGEVTWDDEFTAGNIAGRKMEDDLIDEDAALTQTQPSEGDDMTSVSSLNDTVKNRFVTDSELLRPDARPRNDFQSRNQKVLGLTTGGTIVPTRIVNKIGGRSNITQTKIDQRALLMDEDGNYIDGINRGQVKKGVLEELTRKKRGREEEIVQQSSWLSEWQALPEDEKERRRQAKREANAKLQEQLIMQETEGIPEEYNSAGLSTTNFLDDDTSVSSATLGSAPTPRPFSSEPRPRRQRREWSRSTRYQGSHTESSDQDPGIESERSSSFADLLPVEERSLISRSSPSLRSEQSTITTSDRRRESRPAPRDLTPVTVHPRLSLSIRPKPGEGDNTTDEAAAAQLPPSVRKDIRRLLSRNETHPRIVTVQLHSAVKAPLAEAITSRIQGGLVEATEFFEDERVAIITFVNSRAAEEFVRHHQAVQNSSQNNYHEFRRLQYSSGWYRNSRSEACCPNDITQGLLNLVLDPDTNASRVLRIKGVDNELNLEQVQTAVMSRLANEDRFVIKATLVRSEGHLARREKCSSDVIVEFASISAAIEVKRTMNETEGGFKDWKGCKAEFVGDPVDRMPGLSDSCNCRYCEGRRAGAIQDNVREQPRTQGSASYFDKKTGTFKSLGRSFH